MKTIPSLLCLLTVGLATGCATAARTDLVTTQVVRAEGVSTEFLNVPPPSIALRDAILEISGTVQRNPKYDGPSDWHLHISILEPDGQEIDQFVWRWQPDPIPVTGSRLATYSLQYGWTPPRGTIFRVTLADEDDVHREGNLGSSGSASNRRGVGGGPQQLPQGPRTQSSYSGKPKSGRAAGTPGTPRQPGMSRGSGGRRR